MLEGRHIGDPIALLDALAARLNAGGARIERLGFTIRTIHPQILAWGCYWSRREGGRIFSGRHGTQNSDAYVGSPVQFVYEQKRPYRRRLDALDEQSDPTLLFELRAEGMTDYLVHPMRFTDGSIHVATWTTDRPGGFSECEVAGLQALLDPLARIVEIHMLRHTAANLLETYVGKHAGTRVLAGKIKRGDTETINAAIWLSDMRGFTARADRMAPGALIELLNRYFDCQVPAIAARGGEVLKVMGDGLLAIFPVGQGRDADRVCRDALAAARVARDAIAAIAVPAAGAPTETLAAEGLRFGLALHIGEVLYGNIGASNRLDFTAIGPAVNLVARLGALAGELGRDVLVSAEFAALCPDRVEPLGMRALRGLSKPVEVYGLKV